MILSAIAFALCGVALLVGELLARRADAHSATTELFDRLLASRATRIAILVCWWWLGWHFLVAQTVDH